jgi:hypothetical protein
MKYSNIKKIVSNSYPTFDLDGNTLDPNYKFVLNGDMITRIGLYPDSKVEYNAANLEKIQYIDDDRLDFRFIVVNKNNPDEMWTTKPFYEELVTAKADNNPYFTEKTVSVVTLDLDKFIGYSKEPKFIDGEANAGVRILNTTDTIEEILYHITYMCDNKEKEIRPGPFENKTPEGYDGLVIYEIIE